MSLDLEKQLAFVGLSILCFSEHSANMLIAVRCLPQQLGQCVHSHDLRAADHGLGLFHGTQSVVWFEKEKNQS